MPRLLPLLLAATLAVPASAQQVPEIGNAGDLLFSCQEADNDPRDGFVFELECLRYLGGVVDGLTLAGAMPENICLPEANRDDALRRAFTSWVHKSFSRRSKMPAAEAIFSALVEKFPCG